VSDITLPRAVGLHIRNSLRGIVNASDDDCGEEKCRECAPVRVMREALAALAAALAEPEQKPEPVAFAKNGNLFWCGDASQMRGVDIDLYPAPPQPDAIARAVEAEREACAKVCDDLVLAHPGRADLTADQCAEAIRARGAQMSDAINPDRYKQGDKDCIDAINPNHYKQGDKEGIDALRAALWNGIRARGSK
jgi:hypothetical protein